MSNRDQASEIVAWGSYDESKPRVRLLLDELRARDALRAEMNIPAWGSVRDKAVTGTLKTLKILLRLIAAYPGALLKLISQPAGRAVLLAYPAIPDIFVAWPVARLRRHTIIFDAFISLHDTVVSDRKMLRANGIAARLVWVAEWLALRLADIILVDTDQHAKFFASTFGIPRERFQTILVGAEPVFWDARGLKQAARPAPGPEGKLPTVLFYGQLIPLHGLETILDAVRLTRDDPIQWLLIGSGQEEPKLRRFIDVHPSDKVRWRDWVDYEQLPALICSASVALGVFGTSDKAARVIPNKAFQILATGRPLITRESPAMDSLAKRYPQSIRTVAPGDGAALADAIREAIGNSRAWGPVPLSERSDLGPAEGVQKLMGRLSLSTASSRRSR